MSRGILLLVFLFLNVSLIAQWKPGTDVAGEVNGFMTYDRKVDKMNIFEVKKANLAIINEHHK